MENVTSLKRLRLTLAFFLLAFCLWTPAYSAEPDPADANHLPRFIRMVGEWESYGVRAAPAAVFDATPALRERHKIIAEPMGDFAGVRFQVEQMTGDALQITKITYVYDAASNKSFGVFISSNGAAMRGVIEHGGDSDLLRLYNADDEVVWTEWKVWVTEDRFDSEASFPYNGGEAKVWFETNRVPSPALD